MQAALSEAKAQKIRSLRRSIEDAVTTYKGEAQGLTQLALKNSQYGQRKNLHRSMKSDKRSLRKRLRRLVAELNKTFQAAGALIDGISSEPAPTIDGLLDGNFPWRCAPERLAHKPPSFRELLSAGCWLWSFAEPTFPSLNWSCDCRDEEADGEPGGATFLHRSSRLIASSPAQTFPMSFVVREMPADKTRLSACVVFVVSVLSGVSVSFRNEEEKRLGFLIDRARSDTDRAREEVKHLISELGDMIYFYACVSRLCLQSPTDNLRVPDAYNQPRRRCCLCLCGTEAE